MLSFLLLVIPAAVVVNSVYGKLAHSAHDSRNDSPSVKPNVDFNTTPMLLESSFINESDLNIRNETDVSNSGISNLNSSSEVPVFNHSENLNLDASRSGPTEKQTCCNALPSICNNEGHCVLDMTTCVKLCLCVTGIRDAWCHEILNRLAQEVIETSTPDINELSPLPRSSIATVAVGTPEITNLPPFAVKTSKITAAPVHLHPLTTNAHSPTNNATGMLKTGKTYNSTSSRHSGNSRHHIFGVPGSNSTSQLSTKETGRQRNVNAMNLTEQYRVPKQTRSRPRKTGFFDQTTPLTSSMTSDRSSGESSVESLVHRTPSKTDIKIGASGIINSDSLFVPSSELSLIADRDFNVDQFFHSLTTIMPNEIVLPTSSSDNDHDKSHPCANCPGVCRLTFPSYELVCEDATENRCENFDCGEHGTCIQSNVTNLVSCRCDGMYTGTFCEQVCDLDCGDNGKCSFVNDSATCVCGWNNTGEFCQFLKTTVTPDVRALSGYSDPSPWNLLGVGLALVVVLMVVCVVLPYWTWRRRWLPIRKLVHYFQSHEDDDGKLYDAFVSYKSSKMDEYFVVHKLYPKLEKELDFKLCLHFRDFPPGEAIADNIIQAIENSRRTILILSPSFVESEWCRLEYQKAQQEMLKLKHKIIPIMLQDISDMANVDKNLQQIINTVTFIKWPGEEAEKSVDKFWQLMQCSMPKKKPDTAGSENSLGSCSSQKRLTSETESCSLDTLSDDVFAANNFTPSCGNDKPKFMSNSETCKNAQDVNQKSQNTLYCEQLQTTTLCIENETENTNSTENSFLRDKNISSNKKTIHLNNDRDENIIKIQRLQGNKLKAWKILSNSTSNTTESHS